MDCERVFLGWDSVPLELARDWLLRRAVQVGPSLDLTHLAVCVPTARAGRLLLNVLIDAAEREHRGVLLPPAMLTPGSLVDVLGTAVPSPTQDRVLVPASPLALRLAWKAAIDSLSSVDVRAICGGMLFDQDEPLALSALVARSHARLTAQLATFRAVFETAGTIHGGDMEARLAALARAEGVYAAVLREAGLCDAAFEIACEAPDARSGAALDGASVVEGWRLIVLVGVADVPPALRQRLRVFGGNAKIHALVFAPEVMRARFDELGSVIAGAWETSQLELGRAAISVVDTAEDLADSALGAVAALPRGTRACDVVLGVTEEALLPNVVRRAARSGLVVRPATGGTVADTPTASLLRCVLELIREGTFREWGTLLRHPWFEKAVLTRWNAGTPEEPANSECWLAALDAYVLDHLPSKLGKDFVADEAAVTLGRVLDATLELLGALAPSFGATSAGARRTISEWSLLLTDFLARLLPSPAEGEDDGARPERGGLEELQADAEAAAFESVLSMMASLAHSPSLDRAVGADVALQTLLELASDAPLPPRDSEDGVEAVGWLELPLDPAPNVVVAGLSEGVVPSREAIDPLVPAAVYRALGLEQPTVRLARDAYLLSLLAHSRKTLRIVLSRAGADGEPTLPSRLLFHADQQTLLARARLWNPAEGAARAIARPPGRASSATTSFSAMRTEAHAIPERWSVTAFRDFLASPYLFYLRHIARIEEVEPAGFELLPHRFGTLAHAVLKEFGRSSARDSTDARAIARFLRERFDRLALATFGPAPAVPLWVQGQQALARLDGFAQWQAKRAREGWTIAHAEWSPGKMGVAFAWDKGEIRLTGQIDRVDMHPEKGASLIDYKLQEKTKAPDQAHRDKSGWIDLQLPLYRHLAASLLDPAAAPELAYVTLASDGEVAHRPATWDAAALESADAEARRIIAAVHEGHFQEEGRRPPTSGILGALAGHGHIGEIADDNGSDGEEDE